MEELANLSTHSISTHQITAPADYEKGAAEAVHKKESSMKRKERFPTASSIKPGFRPIKHGNGRSHLRNKFVIKIISTSPVANSLAFLENIILIDGYTSFI